MKMKNLVVFIIIRTDHIRLGQIRWLAIPWSKQFHNKRELYGNLDFTELILGEKVCYCIKSDDFCLSPYNKKLCHEIIEVPSKCLLLETLPKPHVHTYSGISY